MRYPYHTITEEDLKPLSRRSELRAFGKTWFLVNQFGCIMTIDIGKRVYKVSNSILQIENQEQFEARLQREAQSEK